MLPVPEAGLQPSSHATRRGGPSHSPKTDSRQSNVSPIAPHRLAGYAKSLATSLCVGVSTHSDRDRIDVDRLLAGPSRRLRTGRCRAAHRAGAAPRFASLASSFASWAIADRASGEIVGAQNLAESGDTMSMIKAWIAADFLRLQRQRGSSRSRAALRDDSGLGQRCRGRLSSPKWRKDQHRSHDHPLRANRFPRRPGHLPVVGHRDVSPRRRAAWPLPRRRPGGWSVDSLAAERDAAGARRRRLRATESVSCRGRRGDCREKRLVRTIRGRALAFRLSRDR